MNTKLILTALLPVLTLAGCNSNPYRTTEKGVIVKISQSTDNGPKLVRLEVENEKIIRVSTTPESRFSDPQSLIIIHPEKETPFSVKSSDDTVFLETAALKASVLATTGEIRFEDKSGKTLLAEQRGGGKTFAPITVDGQKGWSWRQVFESPDDEAFYGLGQHQSDEFNYKGKNEELFQYNTKVSVPFIISNKGYGLLMDSYSLMRFGNPNDYSQLGEVFKLYSKDGKEGCLTGSYFPQNGSPMVRDENKLYFEHLVQPEMSKVINLPDNFASYNSKVTYEGYIEAPESGEYQFILYYAGYVDVSVNEKEIVKERWRTSWNPNSYKFSATLKAGERVPLKINWTPDGDVSYLGLRAYPLEDMGERLKHSWWSEMNKQMDWYFIAGDSFDNIISGYRTITGKSPIMPKWAMGYWQSRERYKTSTEMIDALKSFRSKHFPIDNIVLDWSHWPEDAWGSHEFDKARFPEPKAMVDSLHQMNAHVMVSVWPKFYVTTEHYKEFDKNGWMYTKAYEDGVKDWIGQGYLYGFYDAYSPQARKLFWQQMYEHYYPLGFDAWWMDASEPNVRDCTDMDYRKALCGPTALGTSTEFFNAYAYMNAEAIYDGQRNADNDKRVFLLTRSGFAGLQRYSTATWSGDIATRWEDMKAQISAGLNFAVSGIPYWTMDIGGFCVENRYVQAQEHFNTTGKENPNMKEWRELNARWFQFGAFCPLYRAHGQYPFREPWEIAPENHPAYKSMLYYTQLRYRLMPYIYSLAGMTWFEDYTIMRPLVMDFLYDENVSSIGDTYMFGPAFLVAPVYEYGARSREIYFPQCEGWYDFYTGKFYEGGKKRVVDAPYERMPLFVRAGSIVPEGPAMEWADEKDNRVLTINLYLGKDGKFTLYEDENVNYNYEKGLYSMIDFEYDEESGIFTVGKRRGSFPGMTENRKFIVKPSDKNGPLTSHTINYSGETVSVSVR